MAPHLPCMLHLLQLLKLSPLLLPSPVPMGVTSLKKFQQTSAVHRLKGALEYAMAPTQCTCSSNATPPLEKVHLLGSMTQCKLVNLGLVSFIVN